MLGQRIANEVRVTKYTNRQRSGHKKSKTCCENCCYLRLTTMYEYSWLPHPQYFVGICHLPLSD